MIKIIKSIVKKKDGKLIISFIYLPILAKLGRKAKL